MVEMDTEALDKIINKGLGIEKGDRVLVIFDNERWEIAEEIAERCNSKEARTETREISVSKERFFEPPRELITPLKSQDILISVTRNSLTLSKTAKEARDKGTKIANLANINLDLLYACKAPYEEMEKRGSELRKKIKKAEKGRITTEHGTVLSFKIGDRGINVESGLCDSKGEVCTYPPGEVSFSPLEDSINGTISVKGMRKEEPLGAVFDVENGEIQNPGDLKSDKVGEIGIGLNSEVELKGVFPHDLKKDGTVHIGVGANFYLGGNIWDEKHYDIGIGKYTLELDGKQVDF